VALSRATVLVAMARPAATLYKSLTTCSFPYKLSSISGQFAMNQTGDYPKKLPRVTQEPERDATPLPTMPQRPRRFWEKLGFYNIAVLFLGTIAILIALAFLFFIWGAATHARHRAFSLLWYDIVDQRWATRVVTLCSVLIRVATAAQLGIFAAILAALILEHVGVATENLPLVSMIRCLNSGPHSLALSIYDSIFSRALFPYSLLIVLAIMNAFALQFTSTILLTDFDSENIVLESMSGDIAFGLNRNVSSTNQDFPNQFGGIDYWKTTPYLYRRFAEYSENGSQGNNYVDTGKTVRGFPPQRSDIDRGILREYNGPMTVVDARVVCVKPTVSKLTVGGGFYASVNGTFDWKDTHPDLISATALEGIGIQVNCSIPFSDYYLVRSYWSTSLCSVGTGVARLAGGITSDNDDPDLPDGHTGAHLLLNVTGSSEDWNASLPLGTELQTQSEGPSWTRYAHNNVSIDFSLCFFNPNPRSYSVTATSETDAPDGALIYNGTSISYNTTNLRVMYGATRKPLTPAKRFQLQLKPKANWNDSRVESVYKVATEEFIWDTVGRVSYEQIYANVNYTESDPYIGVGSTSMFSDSAPPEYSIHRSHAVIFQDILQDTGNPALALQTLFTTLLQMAYYDFLFEYDTQAPAKYKLSGYLEIPCRWSALGVILGLLGLHFVLTFTAVRMFLKQTEMSLLGNSWQAVSQVVSTDTAAVLHNGATATDREVRGTMKQNGSSAGRIRIAKSLTDGRTEATAIRQRHGATYSAPVGQV
jgi:hypothetical protein